MNAFFRVTEFDRSDCPLAEKTRNISGPHLDKATLDRSVVAEIKRIDSRCGQLFHELELPYEKMNKTVAEAVSNIDSADHGLLKKRLSEYTYDDFKALHIVSSVPAYIVGLSVLTPTKLMCSGTKKLHEGIRSGEIKSNIQELYSNPATTGRVLKDAGINTLREVKAAINYGVDTTYNTVKACDYLTTKFALGAAEAAQSAVKHTAEIGANIASKPDTADRISQKDYLRLSDASKAIDRFYDAEGAVKKAGDTVEKTIEATDYYVVKAGLGAGRAVQSGVKFVGEAATTVVGRTDLRSRIADYDGIGDFAKKVDAFYDKEGAAKAVADCSERFGDTATRIALTVLGTTAGGIGGIMAVGASSIINAGDYTEKVYQKYGEIEGKNVLVGTIIGAATALTEKLIPVIDERLMNNVARPVESATYNGISHMVENPTEAYKIAKAAGIGTVRGIEVSMYHTPEIAGKLTEQLSRTNLSVEDRWSKIGRDLAVDSSIGCILGGITSYVGDSIKEVHSQTRELNEAEKQNLKEKLNWSDEKIERNCTIDDNKTVHYKTTLQELEGTTSECGVAYERNSFNYNGVEIEGVFPVFEADYTTQLDPGDYYKSNPSQFLRCNKNLSVSIESDPSLKARFSADQLQDIADGVTPRGYTWHHNEVPGKMQLVKTIEHDKRMGGAAHTGGNSIWGNKSITNVMDATNKEGVTF